MKKILTVAMAALMMMSTAVLLGGCGENNQEQSQSSSSSASESDKKPSEAIIGTWGGRSDKAEVKFNEDGTCEIGGVAGNYKIDKDNKLTVTPKNGESQVFTWVESPENIKPTEWTIKDGKIHINGYQYTNEGGNNKNNTAASSSNSTSSAVSNNSSSSNLVNSGSSSNSSASASSKPGNSQNSSSSPSSSSSSSSNSSSTSSQPATAPTYEQGGEGDETPVPEYVDDLDED